MTRCKTVARRAVFEGLEGRSMLAITPAHVALAQRSVAETTPANNLYTNGNYTVTWAGLNGKSSTVTQADCTTYVTALLKQAYGWTNNEFVTKFGVSSPSLTRYYDEAVADGALDGFKQITDVKIGDYFVSRYLDEGAPARGHMVMFESLPTQVSTTRVGVKAYNATIIDVTGAPHSSDTRTGSQDGTNDSGVGRGNVRFYTDLDGNIQYWAWGTSTGSTTYDPVDRPCIFFKVPALSILAPTNLAAAAASETTVNLSWTDRSGIEDGYAIERSGDNGATWIYVGDVNRNVTTFTDASAVPGSYRYRVYAVAGASESTAAAVAVSIAAVVPATPSAFMAVLSGTKVNLSWTDTSTNETGYTLERSTNDGAFTPLVTRAANANNYPDVTASIGNRYAYRLTAVTPYARSVEVKASLNLAVRQTPVTRPTPVTITTAALAAAVTVPTKTGVAPAKGAAIAPTIATSFIAGFVPPSLLRPVAADVLGF